jgi:hypothetical protein
MHPTAITMPVALFLMREELRRTQPGGPDARPL